ncbi:MAG: phosphoribosylformylglycinamidine synthase subunit PurS [Planctomycetota bacterium]|jgi:phosphoribosylformylglycinamidine synthase
MAPDRERRYDRTPSPVEARRNGPAMPTAVHRIEVRPQADQPDPRGASAGRDARSLGLAKPPARIDAASVYLIQGDLGQEHVRRLADELLADPVTETATVGAAPPRADAVIEVHPRPGVMDPDAEAIESAIRAMLGVEVQVRTARRYDFHGTDPSTARLVAERSLANGVIHAIHDRPYLPRSFPAGTRYGLHVTTVPIGDLDDEALKKLSREAHLFLSVPEMKAIQAEYRCLGREPREIELETIAQTWSEHCVHKTLKSTIRYREPWLTEAATRPGHQLNPDGSITIRNLFKSTIVAATEALVADGIDWCLSVFADNAGAIAFDDEHAVCFKVETHNHPSAIEPYGGAATGIGGCIRDIMGTGLAARPIASTDVFCVAHPDHWTHESDGATKQRSDEGSTARTAAPRALPAGCLHPKRILTQVVAGVRDYGNRMGIPTLNGGVWFDDDYVGNPLVYCGCVGVMPTKMITGAPQAGDLIVALGGRTGRDGIHGATFSSAELTDTHAGEFSHAVQIGNPVTEKKLLDAILEARDEPGGCLFRAVTDCGAGGFSSAVGEMGRHLGAEVHLERPPLKYEGLSPTEIWISEAQERMVLAVPPDAIDRLRAICDLHEVEICELGHFGTNDRQLILRYEATEVGRLSMTFLHEGLPQSEREAAWSPPERRGDRIKGKGRGRRWAGSVADALVRLLAHPNIASKRWIIRQYDHEVQGGSVIKPLVGPGGEGPSDAAVIRPVDGSQRGVAIANGLATGLRDDPRLMTLAAIDECVRNLVCVGADPGRIALLDNFCWPSCDDPRRLGELVRAAVACCDGAIAYRTPFISGKDSLNNQFTAEDGTTIEIPPTLLISGIGIVPDAGHCVTMDAGEAGNLLLVVGTPATSEMGGSHFEMLFGDGRDASPLPAVDLELGPRVARAVGGLISEGFVRSAHDCSDGGLLVAAAEMAMAGGLGLHLDLAQMPAEAGASLKHRCFGEQAARYLLEIRPGDQDSVAARLGDLPWGVVGAFNSASRVTLAVGGLDVGLDELQAAWLGTLDW